MGFFSRIFRRGGGSPSGSGSTAYSWREILPEESEVAPPGEALAEEEEAAFIIEGQTNIQETQSPESLDQPESHDEEYSFPERQLPDEGESLEQFLERHDEGPGITDEIEQHQQSQDEGTAPREEQSQIEEEPPSQFDEQFEEWLDASGEAGEVQPSEDDQVISSEEQPQPEDELEDQSEQSADSDVESSETGEDEQPQEEALVGSEALHEYTSEDEPSRRRIFGKLSAISLPTINLPARLSENWNKMVRFILRRKDTYSATGDNPYPWLSFDEEGEPIPEVKAHWSYLNTPPKEEKWWRPKAIRQTINDLVRRRTMALTVESGIVRIVVFQGKEIIAWGTANPEEDFHATGPDIGALDGGYAPRLYSLLSKLEFRRLRLITELPLYTPLMRHLKLAKVRGRRFLQQIVTSEVIQTIPFTEFEVDITWQIKKTDSGLEMFATSVPKDMVDNHVQVLKDANLQPLGTYPRAVALAFACGIDNVLAVHLMASEAAIVLVHDSVARVVHRLRFPEDALVSHEQAEVIARGIEQVTSHYRNVDSSDDVSTFPIVLTGQMAAETILTESLQETTDQEILSFQPPVLYPDHFPPSEYAANIGLALADRARTKNGKKVSRNKGPAVNLLSERHLPTPLPMATIAAFVTLLLFGVAAIGTTGEVNTMALEAATLSTEVKNLERQVRIHRLSEGQLRTLEDFTQSAVDLAIGLETRLTQLRGAVDDLLAQKEAITVDAPPSDLRVVTAVLEGGEFAISGNASSYEDVIRYTANLRETGLFSSVKITRLASTGSVDSRVRDTEDVVLDDVNYQVEAKAWPKGFGLDDSEGDADAADDESLQNTGTVRPRLTP